MQPKEMIYRRKSVRSYSAQTMDAAALGQIQAMAAQLVPLYPDIPVRCEILGREKVKCILPWLPPHAIAIYTDASEGALENAGFMFQQLELKLQCMGLGVCWLGMGRPAVKDAASEDGLKCVMMLAFGYPRGEQLRESSGFKRKAMDAISDRPDPRLEPARLAPSSVNSQPWRFTHEGEAIHVHCAKQGIVKMLTDMNRIDVGIALAHLYVSAPESFRFFRREGVASPKGCAYIGSCEL